MSTMIKVKKRLALLLIACLLITLVPETVFAAESIDDVIHDHTDDIRRSDVLTDDFLISASEHLFEGVSIEYIQEILAMERQIYQQIRVRYEGIGCVYYTVPVSSCEIEHLLAIRDGNFQRFGNSFPYTRIRYSGLSHDDSIVIILIGDGFTEEQTGTWPNPAPGTFLWHADSAMATMESVRPFGLFSHLFTVYVINATGSHPTNGSIGYLGTIAYPGGWAHGGVPGQASGGELAWANTTQRHYRIRELANEVVNPAYQTMLQVISNSKGMGGSAQVNPWHYLLNVGIAVTSINNNANPPGGSDAFWPNGTEWHMVIIHEFGHSFGLLSDENASVRRDERMANATAAPDEDIKWRHWLGHRGVQITPLRFNGWAVPTSFMDISHHGGCIMGAGQRHFCGPCTAEIIRRMALISGEVFHGRSPYTFNPLPYTPIVTIPDGASRILDSAFHGNTSLHTIIIPASVKTIGDFAFIGATGLTVIINNNTVPQQVNETTFTGVDRSNVTVEIPLGTTLAYTAAGWTGFNLVEAEQNISILTGNGSAINPFLISTASDLAYMAERVNDGNSTYYRAHYRLANDIDLSAYGANWNNGRGWIPIGNMFGSVHNFTHRPFSGSFNGGNNTITGLYINQTGNNESSALSAGLFGSSDGTIKNLSVYGRVTSNSALSIGGIVGNSAQGEIINAHFNGQLTRTQQTSANVGGIVGRATLTHIEDSSSAGVISCIGTLGVASSLGGIVGYSRMSVVINNTSSSNISSSRYAGGIVGTLYGGRIENNEAWNPMVRGSGYVGRVVGRMYSAGALSGNGGYTQMSYVYISSTDSSTPFHSPPEVHNVHNGLNGKDIGLTGSGTASDPFVITTASDLAFMAQRVNAGNLLYTHAHYRLANDIDLSAYGANWNEGRGWIPIGVGLVTLGNMNIPGVFRGSFDGENNAITGLYMNYRDTVGGTITSVGLFGNSSGVVKNLSVYGSVVSGIAVGGLGTAGIVGNLERGEVINSHFEGVVTRFNWGTRTGGVVGRMYRGTVRNSSSAGRVESFGAIGNIGGSLVGGVVGDSSMSVIKYNSSTAFVVGGREVGGIIGQAWACRVENNTALNPLVQSPSVVGRVIGRLGTSSTLSGNFALASMSHGTGIPFPAPPEVHNVHDGVNGADYFPPVLSGSGTASDPFRIYTASDLAYMAERVNAGVPLYTHAHYRLVNDIDISAYGQGWNDGRGWIPIGRRITGGTLSMEQFRGVFDGGNNTITGLYINHINAPYSVGLFGYIMQPVIIKNLHVEGIVIGNTNVGGIVGHAEGNIENCHFYGLVRARGIGVGGIIGRLNRGIAVNNYSAGTVDGGTTTSGAGGIVGHAGSHWTTISNNTSTASVTGNSSVGGIVGSLTWGTIAENNLALNPLVQASNRSSGRIAGNLADNTTLSGNQALASMSHGIGIPFHGPPEVHNVHNGLNGADYFPSVLSGSGTASDPFRIYTASDLAYMAERVNANDSHYAYAHYRLANDIDLSAYGSNWNGGRGWIPIGAGTVEIWGLHSTERAFLGTFNGYGHTISGLYMNHPDSGSGVYVVGLFGISAGNIKNIHVQGEIISGIETLVGWGGTGGIVAINLQGELSYIHFDGFVRYVGTCDNVFVGGIVGFIYSGTVRDSSSSGIVYSSRDCVGGIVGATAPMFQGRNITILRNSSTASVTGSSVVGGIAGFIGEQVVLENNIALNPYIRAGGFVGRVVGFILPAAMLSGNRALATMVYGLAPFPGPPEVHNVHNGLNGEDYFLHILSGSGTASDPFRIYTASDLAYMAERVNAGDLRYTHAHYRLVNNIDLSAYGANWNDGRGWIPIGQGYDGKGSFSGVFDGDNNLISGLYMNYTFVEHGVMLNIALFGHVYSGTIMNLNVLGTVSSSLSTPRGVAGIAAKVDRSVIENNSFNGTIQSRSGNVGGIAGLVSRGSIIRYNVSDGKIISPHIMAGGIVGQSGGFSVISGNTSTMCIEGRISGGIVGIANNSTIENNRAFNWTVQGSLAAARVLGYNWGNVILSDNFGASWMSYGTGRPFPGPPEVYNVRDGLNGQDWMLVRGFSDEYLTEDIISTYEQLQEHCSTSYSDEPFEYYTRTFMISRHFTSIYDVYVFEP